jgi:hypothetical protein
MFDQFIRLELICGKHKLKGRYFSWVCKKLWSSNWRSWVNYIWTSTIYEKPFEVNSIKAVPRLHEKIKW